MTIANRLFRFYVATESRDVNLIIQVIFILKMYAEMWFRKKGIPLVQNGLGNSFLKLDAPRDFDDKSNFFRGYHNSLFLFPFKEKSNFFMIGDLKILG